MSYLRSKPSLLASATALAILGGAALFTSLFPGKTLAQEPMTSSSYEIQLGNFNITSGTKSSGSYTVTDTVGQLAAGEFNSSGYTIQAGFQYLYTLSKFSFSIDDVTVDLGSLALNTFSTASNILTVTTRSGGYIITAAANHPLKNNAGATIPFTNCDTSCTISAASVWTAATNHGFGFNASGTHASADFVNSTYFRPFADTSLSEAPQTIAAASTVVRNDTIGITYKAAIGASQNAGNYENAVTYTAIPSY